MAYSSSVHNVEPVCGEPEFYLAPHQQTSSRAGRDEHRGAACGDTQPLPSPQDVHKATAHGGSNSASTPYQQIFSQGGKAPHRATACGGLQPLPLFHIPHSPSLLPILERQGCSLATYSHATAVFGWRRRGVLWDAVCDSRRRACTRRGTQDLMGGGSMSSKM